MLRINTDTEDAGNMHATVANCKLFVGSNNLRCFKDQCLASALRKAGLKQVPVEAADPMAQQDFPLCFESHPLPFQ